MYNKEQLTALIWDNPQAVTPLELTQRNGGREWHARQYPDGSDGGKRHDRTTLKLSSDSRQIFVHCNGDFPSFQHGDIWDYLGFLNSTNDFIELMRIVADAYGIEPEYNGYTDAQVKRAQQRHSEKAVRAEIASCLSLALKKKYGEEARAYLSSRGLQPTERLGAWNKTIKKALIKHLQEKYPAMGVKAIEGIINRSFPTLRKDYTNSSTGVWSDFIEDYQVIINYTSGNGNVTGFCLRRTTEKSTYQDERGETCEMPKYLYSTTENHGGTFVKGGNCGTLKGGAENVILVEGELDAEALKQNGITNVMALGGMTPTDDKEDAAKSQIKTLQRYNAKKIVYVPDCEYNDAGERKTDATRRTIAALLPYLTGTQTGNGFISIKIANLETAESRQNHTKVDADTFIRTYNAGVFNGVIEEAAPWYEYELQAVVQENHEDTAIMLAAAQDVYVKIANYAQRNQLKDAITDAKSGYLATLKEAGLNAAALTLIDRDGTASSWAARMAEIVDGMQKAKTTERMGELLTKANRIQNASTFNNFAAQVNATREELHRQVAAKPEYLQTSWALHKEKWNEATKQLRAYENRKISFAPAAVSVIAAPTNHGKTLILLQTAINVAKATGKKFIYLSIENDAEQLYVRAVTAYMGNAWENAKVSGEDGKAYDVNNPRAEVRAYIKAQDLPRTLFKDGSNASIDINAYIQRYWVEVAPYLALVRTEADVEAIVNNVTAQVEQWRNDGVEVGGVFIDYLQLLHYPSLHAHARTDEVKSICDRLNDMAKATKLPIIVAAQFNRDATKNNGDTLDGVELANISESAGIENIAEDVYLVWQTNKINPNSRQYTDGNKDGAIRITPDKYRSKRCFGKHDTGIVEATAEELRRNYLYVENLKARDYETGGYCMLPFNGAAGAITSDESEV